IQTGIITARGESSHASVTVDSRFVVQSITKSFTAAVILRLVAAGKLRLDAPLAEWLPDAPNAARITIRQCLQHTSGLPDYGGLPEYHEAVRQGATPWTFTEFLTRTHAEQLLFEPGTGWRYSNIGHMLLRRLIETVCGQSFSETVAAEVCRPLRLRHTSVIRNREDYQILAPAYSFCVSPDGLPLDIRTRYDPGWVATGVVASTASDLVRFYDRLFAGDLLPGHLLDEMRTVVRAFPTPSNQRFVEASYGLGLIADPKSPYGVLYGHSGGGPGYTSAALHVVSPRRQPVTVAVLSNTENFFEVELMAFTIVHALTE
ncbi:MAG TPA: serine hydrolase domain-containing protein, partial [Nitrospiraceae bacterium]|nr:serine hydrolase domain-containing protein [Nitrospiraceae bacterium]